MRCRKHFIITKRSRETAVHLKKIPLSEWDVESTLFHFIIEWCREMVWIKLMCLCILFTADYCEAHVYQDPTSSAGYSAQEVWLRLGGWSGSQVRWPFWGMYPLYRVEMSNLRSGIRAMWLRIPALGSEIIDPGSRPRHFVIRSWISDPKKLFILGSGTNLSYLSLANPPTVL